jgi:tRNA nucleotidyltransferase (CCA-adding enzyme)
MTARRDQAYPQVDPRAEGLAAPCVLTVPAEASVGEVLAHLRRRRARALVAPARRGLVLLADLARAAELGLERLTALSLATPAPVLPARAPEASVRRALLGGARAVLVVDGPTPIGVVDRALVAGGVGDGRSLASRLERRLPAETRQLLAEVARIAAAAGTRSYVVGGLVRDMLDADGRGRPTTGRRDIDVVVEGDGVAVARRLARGLRGALRIHHAFGTASIEGLRAGRLDVATARAEHYEAPGALPRVRKGTIVQDLERRDFSVNAMAVELGSGAFGLLDPVGGRADLRRRRLRVLHPLSFVEDPTRVFRGARYAGRLGFALDGPSRRARRLAIELAPYPALSGARILAEIERVLAEPKAGTVLRQLGRVGAFRLVDPRLGLSRTGAAALAGLDEVIAWLGRRGLAAGATGVALLAIVAGQPDAVAEAALRRLGLAGEALGRLLEARREGPTLAARLAAGGSKSRLAALARERPAVELAWAWLTGGPTSRGALTWYLEHGAGTRPALRGDDLLALGVPAGPAVGAMLRRLRDARLDGRAPTRGREVALVRRWIGSSPVARKER